MNKIKYGQSSPPVINLSNIYIPIALIVGSDDDLASPVDAKITKSTLKNVIFYKEYDNLNHEMLLSKDVSYMTDVLEVLQNKQTE